MAQGVGQAIAENNLAGKVGLIGFDSDEKLVKFLNDGVISGARRPGPVPDGL